MKLMEQRARSLLTRQLATLWVRARSERGLPCIAALTRARHAAFNTSRRRPGMTTIRLMDAANATGKTKEIFDAVLRREQKVFGATSVSNIWRCMGHSPALLEANWNRSRALMQRGQFSPLQRELVATAVSVANACTY